MANESLQGAVQSDNIQQETEVVAINSAAGQPLDLVTSPQEELRDSGIDDLPMAEPGLQELQAAEAEAHSEVEEQTDIAVEAAADTSPEPAAIEVAPMVEQQPTAEQSDQQTATASEKSWIGSITDGAKGLWNAVTGNDPDESQEQAETEEREELSFIERIQASTRDAWNALVNPQDEDKSYWERFTDSFSTLLTPFLPSPGFWGGIGGVISDVWSKTVETAKKALKPPSAREKEENYRFARDCNQFLLGCEGHLGSSVIHSFADEFYNAANDIDGLELKAFNDKLLLDRFKRRLEGIASALEEYGRSVAEEEKEDSKEEGSFFEIRDQRERLAEMVESLVAGTEDHPELVRYIHDEYRQELPVSELVEMMLALKKEHEEELAEAVA